jgi:hypothetical protein
MHAGSARELMTRPTSDRLDAYFAHVEATNPPALRIWIAEDEAAFCAAVEDAVEHAMLQIEAGARLYNDLGEVPLSQFLTQLLASASVPTVAEGYHNGHVDVTIRQPAGQRFLMLGECKIYDGFEHHCTGCRQLLIRYSSGRSARSFCLDFFHKPDMYEKLRRLREEFDAQRPLDQVDGTRDHRIKGAFLTAHRHVTAAIIEVLHLGCNVFHPEAGPVHATAEASALAKPREVDG